MKKVTLLIAMILVISMLAGCAGTPVVYYSDCTCPPAAHEEAPMATEAAPGATEAPAEGAVKTGLYMSTSIGDSKSATAEEAGEAKYDVTVVAVTVDNNGVIQDCIIDSVPGSVKFDASGVITSDIAVAVQTKNELGESYGMKAYGGAKYEWNEQAAALANFAVGKTLQQLKEGAVSESGHAVDADLATTATIYLGGYVSAIEAAVNNAQHLGAQAGEELKLAILAGTADSKAADSENAGTAQLNVDVAAVTASGDVITSCYIDSLQAKVGFDNTGAITTDLTAPVQTKNELGEAYGMKAYAGSQYEWNEQAASFAAYVTGKTLEQVQGIAVTEGKPSEADLAATVTIAIGGFQALIAKAMQ